MFRTKAARDLNFEQKAAVQSILEGCNRPLPFLVFGPPGTGKTKTIVAAIAEIIKTTKKHVLVCSMSNVACDEIMKRLLKILEREEVFRMYAKTHKPELVHPSIMAACNLRNGKFSFPCLQFLYGFRVLVCTIYTAGVICRARDVDPYFDASHFSYTFIDEAAFVHETTTLSAIAGK